jgi:hypothetical protein
LSRLSLIAVLAAVLLLTAGCGTPDAPALSMAAKENLHTIAVGLDAWARRHHHYPASARVSADGLARDVTWPANPWTGKPMVQGTDPGDFTYARSSDASSAALTGYGAHGELLSIDLPEPPP